MAYDFPSAPAMDDVVTFADGKSYTWNGVSWKSGGASAAAAQYVLKAGDTMTGALYLPLPDPVAPEEAVNKQYVDGRAAVFISDTEPPTPKNRDLWWKSDSGDVYLRYDDGSSVQWVEFGGETETTTLFEVLQEFVIRLDERANARLNQLEARIGGSNGV